MIMQERERERLQKMGTGSMQSHSLLQSRKKKSFSLPSFRRSSADDQRQEVARSEEEAARVQKVAAWQRYTREAVVPTKRPPAGKSPSSQAPIDDKSVVDGRSAKAINELQLKKPDVETPLAESPRAASRFKAEARPTSAGAPSAGPNCTPGLYDEFELSGLQTHMADFVQPLQFYPQAKDNKQSSAQKSKPLHISVDDHGRPLIIADHLHSKAPPPAAAAISRDHLLTKPPPSAAPAIPFHMKPFSALHRLFRKVVSGPIIKSTKNSPLILNSPPAFYEPEVLPEKNTPYHFHHYIHHHHHHYHYGQSPEESTAPTMTRSCQRRHSESSDIRPHIPSCMLEAESDEEEEAVERISIEAYLARRRRHSDSFAGHLTPQKAAFDEEEEMKGEFAKEALPLQMERRYNSKRFSRNQMVSEDLAQPEFDEGFPGIRSRRRLSAEYQRDAASLERKVAGGGKSGGGTYKLDRAADGATLAKPLVRRRHSEGLQIRPEEVHYEMGKGKPAYSHSHSVRYNLEDVLERQIRASAIANTVPAHRPRPPTPKIYPQ